MDRHIKTVELIGRRRVNLKRLRNMSHSINTLIAEDRKYYDWERAQKNRILAIHNPTRRTEEWKKYFGVKQERSDDYLLGEVF
jgi:hypothetical protein